MLLEILSTAKGVSKKPWTFMIYIAADNNLEGEAYKDLKEMKSIGSNEQVNIVAQMDVKTRNIPTRRYFLKKGTTLEKDLIGDLGETNTGDIIFLQRFVEASIADYPAERYLLVISNHGWGWVNPYEVKPFDKDKTVSPVIIRREIKRIVKATCDALYSETLDKNIMDLIQPEAIADDETSGDYIDNLELKKVMNAIRNKLGKKIDVLGFDACCMAGVEIAYQLRGTAEFLVASEDLEPTKGWPWQPILEHLTKNPNIAPRELSSLIVQKYVEFSKRDSSTLSACELEGCEQLAKLISDFAILLIEKIADDRHFKAIQLSHKHAQIFDEDRDGDRFVDFYDFCYLVKKNCIDVDVRTICGQLMKLIADKFVIENGYHGTDNRNANGISIYLPPDKIKPGYGDLDFIKNTEWGNFVTAYLKRKNHRRKTRKPQKQ